MLASCDCALRLSELTVGHFLFKKLSFTAAGQDGVSDTSCPKCCKKMDVSAKNLSDHSHNSDFMTVLAYLTCNLIQVANVFSNCCLTNRHRAKCASLPISESLSVTALYSL